jgi:hypothetical protein
MINEKLVIEVEKFVILFSERICLIIYSNFKDFYFLILRM